MSKYCKWGGIAVSVPLLLVAILFALFYFPPFQRWAVGRASAYASAELGMDIRVGRVRLAFPLDLSMGDVLVLQPRAGLAQAADTVVHVGEVVADVQLWPLLRRQVMVDELTLRRMRLNTIDLIPTVRIRGDVGRLTLAAHGIDLGASLASVDHALLDDARLDVALVDTVIPDTAPSKNLWRVKLADARLKNTDFTLHLPGDTLSVAARMGDARVWGTLLDLGRGLYAADHIDWRGGALRYDRNFEPRVQGLDYSHLALSDLTLRADSFRYHDSKLDLAVREVAFREKGGMAVEQLRGRLAMDSTRLALPGLRLKTKAGTELAVDYAMDMDAFADSLPGAFTVNAKGQVGRQDLLMVLGGSMPRAMARRWPGAPMVVVGEVRGNLQRARLRQVRLALPGAFRLAADGFVENLAGTAPLKANLDVKATTGDLGFVTATLDKELMKTLRIPRGIGFDGNVRVDGDRYASTFTASQGGGTLRGRAELDAARMAYNARLTARALPLQHFLPTMGLRPFTGDVELRGEGTDLMSPRTRLVASTRIRRLGYGGYALDNIDARATVRNGHVVADVDSRNTLLRGRFTVDAQTRGRRVSATLAGRLSRVDLHGLGLADQPLALAADAHVDLVTDLKASHRVRGTLDHLTLTAREGTLRPETVTLDILTARDTTHAIVNSGDFRLNVDATTGYERLLRSGEDFVRELGSQLRNRVIDQQRLRARLPEARVYLASGRSNVVSRILAHYGYQLDNVFMDLAASPSAGINGQLRVDSLVVDSFQVDTVRLRFTSDDTTMSYAAQFQNGKDNPKYIFNALLDGAINERGTTAKLRLYDARDRLGVRLSLAAAMEQHGIGLHLFDDKPVLGYKEFAVNDSNYVFFGDDRRIRANMALRAADGMGVQIYTDDDNADALQDVTVSLHRFDLGAALAMIPYTPDLSGMLDGDFHLIQTERELSVSSSMDIAQLVYEGSVVGDVGADLTYMPRPDGGHFVDGTLKHDGREVGVLTGTYHAAGRGVLDATLDLQRLPLDMLNGFIPDKVVGFRGYAEGQLAIRGSLARPDVNGEVYLDSSYVFSEPYGVDMRFANDPVTVKNSRLLFENFEMFAHNNSPLTLQGYFDFADTDRMNLNVRMRADNFLLVDAEESTRSEAYGRAYVNFMGLMQGPVDNLRLRGRLDVLGTTDLKYNLKDSPLSTDNQLEGLVQFVNFADSAQQVVSRPPLTGLDMDLTISIDEGAHVDCYLNADHTNYIDIVGGGDMRMRYNVVDDVRLTGRYTIGSGEMKYALPIIPLKTFTIRDGSYIEFRGDPMNPTLHITATEEAKATVGGEGGDGRVVEFTSGVVVTKTLNDMGLEFVIDAPDDMTIHNQLQVMSKEERGKIAVTMLTTGMYLADGNTSGFTMNSALSAFLNSQINQLSSKALRTLDVSFGVDNSIGSSGALHTDYNFKFAKRFWNNRLRVVVGGRLSSGADVVEQDNTFFDNVMLEYRLSPTSNKYLKLFYERDDYDWLEGDVSRFGAGFAWRRKLRHFRDIFRFGSDRDDALPTPSDSTQQDSIRQ